MILLDTHVLIWAAVDRKNLSPLARAVLSSGQDQFCLSAGSTWEIATKFRLGKLPEVEPLMPNLVERLRARGYNFLRASAEHFLLAGSFAMNHKDPFDRLIAAQASLDGMPLLSADAVFDQFPVKRIW